MAAIFISHSSKDAALAAELQRRLHQQGHRSIFLDFDPAGGIPAGRDWERELYMRLRACRAMIVLCSEHTMSSRWCFAEITHAKAMGKPLFPIKIAECEIDSVLTSRQAIDLVRDGEAGYERLWAGLKAAGIDAGTSFDWDGKRPPYPGLMAFDEQDAAVFFGRGGDIQETLERLHRLRRFGGPRLLIVLGPSGSGKSSLVRAGVLPRLRRDPDRWLVLEAFRPRTDPLRELAIVFARAFTGYGRPRDWPSVHRLLTVAAASDPPRGAVLAELAAELQIASGRRDSRVVLTLDQVEELLGAASPGGSDQLLNLLRAALDGDDCPLLVLGTMRSDFLGQLQEHPAVRGLAFDDIRIGPMSADGLVEVINGPARVAGIDIEPGLTEALIEDTETQDALPLLAYTLRELYERFGADRRLEIDEYREQLGGLAASVATAAEAQLAACVPVDERALRDAFLAMVRIDEEGHYARRPVRWADLPGSLRTTLDRFVHSRLLISSGDGGEPMLEVAHEALFRSWGRLRSWLDEDRELLLWQQRMRSSVDEWLRADRESAALLRGGRLSEARRWLDHASGLPDDIRMYVDASCEQEAAERGQTERRRRRALIGLAGGLGAALLLAGIAVTQWSRAIEERRIAEAQSRIALARQLAAQSQVLAEAAQSELVQRALLVAESLRRLPTLQAFIAWNGLQATMPRLDADLAHEEEVLAVAWSPDGTLVATGDVAGVAHVWQPDTGERRLRLRHEKAVGAIAFSPDGALLATAEDDGAAHLWDLETGVERARLEQIDGKPLVMFSPDGARLATAAWTAESGPEAEHVFHLWDTATGALSASLVHPGDSDSGPPSFSPDGQRLATTGPDRTVRVWDVATGAEIAALPEPWGALSVDFSPDGKLLATGARWEGEIRIWDVERRTEVSRLQNPSSSFVHVVRFSPDGTRLAAGGQSVLVWDVATAVEIAELATVNPISALAFNADGSLLTTLSGGAYVSPANARVWETETGREIARLAPEVDSTSLAVSPDGTRLVTGGGDARARVWSLAGRAESARLEHDGEVRGATFGRSAEQVISFGDQTARIWSPSTDTTAELTYSTANAGGIIESVELGPDLRRLATSHQDGSVVLWDLETAQRLVSMEHDATAWSATFSPDGTRLATASADHTARIWNAENGRELARLTHDDNVWGVAFSPDGARLATASADETVRVWTVDAGQQQLRLEHGYAVYDVEFTPDGAYLASLGEEDSRVQLWSSDTGARSATLEHDDAVVSLDFSPDGLSIATASLDGTAVLWSVASGEPRLRLVHEGPVSGASYSADGAWLVTWSAWETTARIWDVATGNEVARVAHDGAVEDAELSADSRWLLTASEDRTVRIWKWQAEDVVAEICSRVTRNLTRDEWRRFVGEEPYRPTCSNLPSGE